MRLGLCTCIHMGLGHSVAKVCLWCISFWQMCNLSIDISFPFPVSSKPQLTTAQVILKGGLKLSRLQSEERSASLLWYVQCEQVGMGGEKYKVWCMIQTMGKKKRHKDKTQRLTHVISFRDCVWIQFDVDSKKWTNANKCMSEISFLNQFQSSTSAP